MSAMAVTQITGEEGKNEKQVPFSGTWPREGTGGTACFPISSPGYYFRLDVCLVTLFALAKEEEGEV
jgi:hypothetical protein